MSRAELLRAVLAKLDGGKAWTRGQLAKDSMGGAVDHDSPDAVCWCLVGALRAVIAPKPTWAERWMLRDKADALLKSVIGKEWNGLAAWNDADGRRWEDVQSLLQRAIAHADSTEGSP